jgi:hypothetical protein
VPVLRPHHPDPRGLFYDRRPTVPGVKGPNDRSGIMKQKRGGPNAQEIQKVKRTPRGLKGPPKKKPLPPWRDIKDQLN